MGKGTAGKLGPEAVSMRLVDTDVLVDFGRAHTAAGDFLETAIAKETTAVSVITAMELAVGCRHKIELKTLQKFLG